MSDSPTRDYLTSERSIASIEAWKRSADHRPDVLIVAPALRDVGEQQLIRELALASYQAQGFRDAHSRHFLSRTFPKRAEERQYAHFLDESFDVAEITNGFFGVDNIDLTEWVDASLELDDKAWRTLTNYVLDHPETDFVFTVFSDDPRKADPLVRSIRESCGIAVEVIELGYPDVSMLTRAFGERSEHRFAGHTDLVAERIQGMCAKSSRMNYSFIASCALSAIHELAVTGDERKALEGVFDRFSALTPQQSCTHVVGF